MNAGPSINSAATRKNSHAPHPAPGRPCRRARPLSFCQRPLPRGRPAEIPGKAAYLSKFYLSAETRGTGLARELMDAAIAAARADGKDGLHLGTHQLNHRAQAFYEKMGFTRVGERTFQLTATEVAHDYIYHLSI